MASLTVCFAWINRVLKVQATAHGVALNDLVAHGEYLKVLLLFLLQGKKKKKRKDLGGVDIVEGRS